MKGIITIALIHNVLKQMQKEVADGSVLCLTCAAKLYRAKTNVSPFDISIGDYVMIPIHAKLKQTPQSNLRDK